MKYFVGTGIALCLLSLPAHAAVDGWRQVHTSNTDYNGYLNCRSQPSLNAPIQKVYHHGEAVFGYGHFAYEGNIKWEFVRKYINDDDYSACWVSRDFLIERDATFFKGRIYTGSYISDVNDQVNGYLICRKGPGLNYPQTGTKYRYGQEIFASRIHFDMTGYSWFFTQYGCYVRSHWNLIQWNGFGEDPNTMFNYFTERG